MPSSSSPSLLPSSPSLPPSSSLSSSNSSSHRSAKRATSSAPKRRKAAKAAKKAERIRARKAWAETCAQHKPFKWIGKRMLPSNTNRPPLLHFGFGVKTSTLDAGESLVRYAKEKGLYEDIFDDDGSLDIGATIIIPYSLKYDIVVAVYSNWDIENDRLPPREEKKIFDAIRQVLGDPEQVPIWYHDALEEKGSWPLLPRSRPFRDPTLWPELMVGNPSKGE
ncbi:hypothetical protein K488DRAFT_83658 [Vararia minispora EC-137]|uniref:Uncharacterized protein n=1 Tax=Vararia minispora EC-137 TaxID=1314806 RepID=A0ACB8QT03_9AGAM|nr:hypothetical protein K488DRAFT_83658 [Vararia minispora EC-137]